MLDQNTDRIYWTIGAVIVIGALIVIAHQVFPNLFQNVIAVFQAKLTEAQNISSLKK